MPKPKRTAAIPELHGDADGIVRLWLLRILDELGGHRKFVRDHGFDDDSIARVIGLTDDAEDDDREHVPAVVRLAIHGLRLDAEEDLADAPVPACLARNARRMADLVGLDEVERRILELAVLVYVEPILEEASSYLDNLGSSRIFRALSGILALPEPEVRAALSTRGVLTRSGLVHLEHDGYRSGLRPQLGLLSDAFADRMTKDDADPITLLRDTVGPTSAPTLSIGDFGHVADTLAVLEPYLERSLAESRSGVNVLIYGEPGTGKSQLARVLARRAGADLYEIASEDSDGDPIGGERRLRAFRAAQCFLAQRRALVLFDEAEDVFDDGGGLFGRRSTAQHRKAWMNRALEANAVPAIWLSNVAACLDPAFVRRFDVVLELGVPPRRERERIVAAACGDLLRPADLARFVASEVLAPAVVTRAASVVHTIRDRLPPEKLSGAVAGLVESTLLAQGHGPLARHDPMAATGNYDPAFVNADADLEALAAGIAESRSGRLCLYGPPGTGKSAFGRWLADRLGVPLHARRVSDIVSPYVGVTEKNLLRAFREADAENGVLLLDEVDSFLRDRRGAERSWEVTQVNEMLTQMESFGGVFVATTNLMDGLDPAALRRFDIKLRFDYLRPDQARRMLARQCGELGLCAPSPDDLENVARLAALTPGDFAAVARQHRFRRLASASSLVRALEGECALKPLGPKRAIGFH